MLDFLRDLYTFEFYPNNPIYKCEAYKSDVDTSLSDRDIYTLKVKVYESGQAISDNELIFTVPKVIGDTINTGTTIRTAIITGRQAKPIRPSKNGVGVSGFNSKGSINLFISKRDNAVTIDRKTEEDEEKGNVIVPLDSFCKYFSLLSYVYPGIDPTTVKDLSATEIMSVNDYRLNQDAQTKLRIYYKDRNISNRLNKDTVRRILDLITDFENFNDPSNLSPIDFKYIDVNEGLISELRKSWVPLRRSIQSTIRSNKKVYFAKVQNAINKYFKMQSDDYKNIQVCQNSNALTIQSQSRKIYFQEADKKGNFEKIRLYNDKFIGVLDPIQTTEANMINIKNELSNATIIDNNGRIFIKVYNMKFELEAIEYSEYIVSKVLTIDNADYLNKKIFPNEDGKYVIYQYGEYDEIEDPDEIDYIFNKDALVSPSTSIIPFIQNTDTVRGMMSGKHSEQSIPILGAKPPIVYTKGGKEIYEKSTLNVKSSADGTVTEILNDEWIKVLTDQGKEKVYHVDRYFNSVNSTSNRYDSVVKVGDTVKKGQDIFVLNSFHDQEFTTCTPAYVAYTTIYSAEHEDGMVLRRGFLKQLAHPCLDQIEIVLTADKRYYFDSSEFDDLSPEFYDKFGLIKPGTVINRKDTLFRYYEELSSDDDYARLLKAIAKDETVLRFTKNIEVPFYIETGTIKNVKVFTNVDRPDNADFINYYKDINFKEVEKYRSFSHDKKFNIANPRESDGDIQYTIVIDIEYLNMAKISDKIA